MAEVAYEKRVRINISTSVKGVKTWDATIEMMDTEQEIVLVESDKLVKALDSRYPPVVEEKK